jgi:hypothetical protein
MRRTARRHLPRLLGGLAVVLALAGCDGKGEISGKVRYNGKPLTAGRVTYTPQENPGAAVYSMILEDGSYKVADCPAGPARITVQTVVPRSSKAQQGAKPGPGGRPPRVTLPVRYADPATSGLDYTVRSGSQEYDIDLRP